MTSMPFGAYKGRPLADLPDHYVAWLHVQPWLRAPLDADIRAEAARRHRLVRKPRGPARVLAFTTSRLDNAPDTRVALDAPSYVAATTDDAPSLDALATLFADAGVPVERITVLRRGRGERRCR